MNRPPPAIGPKSAAAILCLAFAACDRPHPAPTEPSAPKPGPREVSFGGGGPGFVSWVDASGNLAVTHRFDEDHNGDGRLDPLFGDHGEPTGDRPSVWLERLDIPGPAERFDELITTAPGARWVVLRRGADLVAISADRRWELREADVQPDPSPCAPARQASIDPTSTWLVFLRAAPHRAVVKHLGTGEETEIPADGPLWRAHAMPLGWVLLRELTDDTDRDGRLEMPRQQGSCICRWCSRFATSVGTGRLVGDVAREVMVDRAGRRSPPPPGPIPIAPDAVWSLGKNTLHQFDGSPRPLPRGCTVTAIPLGAERLVLSCDGRSVVWDPTTQRRIEVDGRVEAIDTVLPPSGPWLVVAQLRDGERRIGRLHLETGVVEEGPPAFRWGAPHPSGWRLVADEQRTYAYDAATGTTTVLEGKLADLDGLTAREGSDWLVIDPHRATPRARLSERPRFVAANGCYVAPHPFQQIVPGPFQWTCP